MDIFYYLLEANIYLCVFFAFYQLVLKRETYYNINRFYLIFSTIIAFILPLFTIEHEVLTPSSTTIENISTYSPVNQIETVTAQQHIVPQAITNTVINYQQILLLAYFFIAVSFLIGMFLGIFKIIQLYKNAKRFKADGAVHILINNKQDAFSFFNWLFYHPSIEPNKAVIAHEMVHIKQYHSIDILFFEFVKAICWFNPVNYFIIKDVKLNHEYIADEVASTQGITKYSYACLLIEHAAKSPANQFVNAIFNGTQLEKRIEHLNKKRSAFIARLKLLGALPLLVVLLFLSSFTVVKNYGLIRLSLSKKVEKPVIIPVRNASVKTHLTENAINIPGKRSIPKKVKKTGIAQPVKRTNIHIDATTDTVKIREVPTNEKPKAFAGLYAIGDKTYTDKELRSVLSPTGKSDILFEDRPVIGVYGKNNAYAIDKWGAKAKKGVIFVQPRNNIESIFDTEIK